MGKTNKFCFRTLAYVSLVRKHKHMFCSVVEFSELISKLEWILQVFDSPLFYLCLRGLSRLTDSRSCLHVSTICGPQFGLVTCV